MNPEFLDRMSWQMAEVYGAITDQILVNLARYFPFFEEGNLPASSFAYQSAMLAQMGQVNSETVRIIRNNLKDADKALQGVLEQAIVDSVKKIEPGLYKAVKAGIFKPAGFLPPIVAPNQMRAFTLYYQQASEKLNLVNTVMLESTQSAYQQAVSDVVSEISLADRVARTYSALEIGAGETVTGVSSWNQALRHSIARMQNNGITGFIDHAGHKWSAEAYVAMDIRTTVFNTGRAAVWETNQNFGNDLYQVSWHNGARPLCYPWQNKVISSTDNSRTVTDLDGNEIHVYAQSETTYGQAAGLFGINCKHYPNPFIPGVSTIRGEPQDEEENAKTYAESQEQRRLERKLREEKRDLLTAKAQGATEEELRALRNKCRNTSQDIDDFCEQTGRARHRDREGVYTKRDFPDSKKYDVAAFERQQQEWQREYFGTGGAQQKYTAGQMTPNAPLVPNPPTTPVAPSTPTPNQTPTPASTFTPAKTRVEAEDYAKRFAVSVKYSGNISLDAMNGINKTLTELNDKYPIRKLGRLENNGRLKTANARANGGILEMQGKAFVNKTTTYSVEAWHSSAKAIVDRFPDGIVPKGWQQSYDAAIEKLKFRRWSVSSEYGTTVATIPHEYGHILSDQYFGMINGKHYCADALTQEARDKVQLVKDTFSKAKKTGDIYKISQYAKTDADEFFAESFAAKWVGEQLPDYIDEMLERVLK